MNLKFTLASTFLLLTCTIIAQIPNYSFETWETVYGHLNPASWGTMNNKTAYAGLYTATKGTPGNPGTAYLKLTSKKIGTPVVNGIAVCGVLDSITLLPISGFAFTDRPQSFIGKWQHMIYGTSQGSIKVTLTRWNFDTNQRETIAIANKTLVGMAMAWEAFTINFAYQSNYDPDTCIILLKASGTSPTANDYLWVDNLSFSGYVVGISEKNNSLNKINIFPNPCSDKLNLSIYVEKSADIVIQLYDIEGKIIQVYDLGVQQGTIEKNISVSNLAKGKYFINIITDGVSAVKPFVIE
ncbi:MAG: hypothetical protein A2046_05165 [Bacteroidetes bacterium GWA2_30_7]|nr:MAG: hypothetical protein A2046_05165 [Bacteroidetes bacterium GWA2_30_7]